MRDVIYDWVFTYSSKIKKFVAVQTKMAISVWRYVSDARSVYQQHSADLRRESKSASNRSSFKVLGICYSKFGLKSYESKPLPTHSKKRNGSMATKNYEAPKW